MHDVAHLDRVLLPRPSAAVAGDDQVRLARVDGAHGGEHLPRLRIGARYELIDEGLQVELREADHLARAEHEAVAEHGGRHALVPDVAVHQVLGEDLAVPVPAGGIQRQHVDADRLVDAVLRVLVHRRVGAGDDHVP